MSQIKSTLTQLRADRAAGMPTTARFSTYTGPQLDALEDVLSLLLEAETLGDVSPADADERVLEAELRQSIKEGLLGAVISEEESLRRVRQIAETKLGHSLTSSSVRQPSALFADAINEREARRRLMALRGTQNIRKVPRR